MAATNMQGDAPSSPLLSELQGHGPCFLKPYVVLKTALSSTNSVFWTLGMGDLRTACRATAGLDAAQAWPD